MQRQRVRRMAHIGLFAALISVCAWIAIPSPSSVPMTLQSFAVLLAAAILRGWDAPIAVLVYLALGLVGLPVFSGMRGGIGVLLSPTGGFLLGFVAAAGWMAYSARFRAALWQKILCLAAAQVLIYVCGTVWFAAMSHVSFSAAIFSCVLPYLLPDIGKLLLAFSLSERLQKSVSR